MPDEEKLLKIVQSQKFMDAIPHIKALGARLVDFSSEHVTVKLPYNEELVGDPDTGVLAGGAISALLDNVCGSAIIARTMKASAFATLDLRIDYMKPAKPGADVYARAECYKLTRKIAFVRGVAYQDSEDNPIATAAATFMFTGKGVIDSAVEAVE